MKIILSEPEIAVLTSFAMASQAVRTGAKIGSSPKNDVCQSHLKYV